MTSIENRKPVAELADALRQMADCVEAGQMPGVRRREAKVIARVTREDAEVVELALNDAWTEMQTEVGAARGEALLWRAVVLDLVRAYSIPDIGEHLEHNGIPGCEDCGGILPLGDDRTFCDHCQEAAEADALAVVQEYAGRRFYWPCDHSAYRYEDANKNHTEPCAADGCMIGRVPMQLFFIPVSAA